MQFTVVKSHFIGATDVKQATAIKYAIVKLLDLLRAIETADPRACGGSGSALRQVFASMPASLSDT